VKCWRFAPACAGWPRRGVNGRNPGSVSAGVNGENLTGMERSLFGKAYFLHG